MVGYLAVEPEATEPAIREVQMHLLTQPPLRADTHAVTDDQHSDHQLRVGRRPPHAAVERLQFGTDAAELEKMIYPTQHVIDGDMVIEAEIVE